MEQQTKVTIQKISVDNRTVIEVKGKLIVLSEVKLGIESILSNSEVHEVRIYAGISLSVDANLSCDVWHGRNLVVLANEIKVNNAVTWDVSGKDNDYAYTSDAGTGEDGLGKDGSDGYPGESGGNVLVQANTIQNSELLTIISNGGNGGSGQDGGNGHDGVDGLGIFCENFEEYFPYSSMFSRSDQIARITKIVQNIYDMSKSVRIEWMKLKSSSNDGGDYVEGNLLEHLKEDNYFDIYLHVVTDEGNEIMFSLWDETTQCHSFLVYKGSPGQYGKSGGKYGMGGQGGFPGEIAVMGLNSRMKFGICSQKTWGNDGTNGAGGFNGQYGKNGWDMGFFGDLSSNVTIYGADQNSILEFAYHEESSSDNIYHPYMAKQNECNGYVTIHEVKNDQPYFIRERNNTIARKERQNHSRAVGKKSVPRIRIAAAFSEYLQEVERERKDLKRQRIETEAYAEQKIEEEKREKQRKNNLESEKERNEKEKHEMEVNLFEKEQLEKLDKQRTEYRITNLCIKRYLHNSQKTGQYLTEFVELGEMYKSGRKKKIVKDLKDNLSVEMWLQLQTVIIDLPELSVLVENFKTLKPSFHNLLDNAVRIRINTVAKTLKMKYKFAILKEIALKLPIYHDEVSTVIHSTPQETKYLEETRVQDDSKKHPMLGPLRQYIFENTPEQRRSFSKFVDKTLKTRQGKTFSSLYDRLTHEENAKAFWERCCVDEQMLKTFQKHWEQEGFISKYYRALLANVYDVNIRLYTRDADGKIVLLEEHNPTSFKTTSILLKSNKPTQLEFNHKYCQLEEERLDKDEIYRRILRDVSAMRSIKELKRYFKNELYNHTNSSWVKKSVKLDEEVAIGRISAFFPAEERELISQRLKNISSQNTGQEGVFESLLERFSFEGCHVSLNELCFLINSILSHAIEARQERYTFSWIISAYNQCNWTDELVLLQLENYFKSQLRKKAEWRSYMSNIRNKGVLLVFAAQFARKPCSAQCVEEILHLLSHMPIKSVCLDQVELTEWPYALKKYYWTLRLQSLTTWDNIHNLTSATYFILSIENNHGKDKLEKLFEILKGKRDDLRSAWFNEILKCFHNQKWIMHDDVLDILKDKSLKAWQTHLNDTNKISSEELNVSQITNIIQGNANTSNKIKGHLANIQVSVQNIKQNQTLLNDKLISSFTVDDIKEWSESFRTTQTNSSFEKYEEMLAVVDRAVELKRGFRLRDTQLLTVLALLANDKKTLAQVSTGEGKTLIVVATAVIKGLLGEKVDIITSSPVLAQRDASENQDIYELFGLSASHNCSENMEERKGAYSLNQIVYGDLANFQRDYLLDSFYGKHMLKDRSFDNVIVDEVDSMLLDKENSMLNLSHHIAGLDLLESLYVFIWQMVNIQTDFTKDDIETIKRSVLSDMYPSIEVKDIASLDKALGKSNVLHLWERLVMSGIINGSGRLLTEEIDSNTLDKAVSPDFTQYKDRLSFLLRSRIDRNTYIKVPNFLKSFVERHLDSWISSAVTALNMDPKQYYVVDVDRSGTSAGRHANVIILDRDTGFDQHSSQWDEALHQFLQLKHGCKLSTQNLKAVFISNVTYLKMYKLLYGLTGTLGSQRERHLLEDIHEVDFVTIPTHKSKQFEEYEPIVCSSKETWMHYIREEVNKLITTDKRSVLIICETIRDVESLKNILKSGKSTNVYTYVRDYEKFSFADGDKMLEPGQIIIATNLARHGSSIKLSNELRNAGGLHVILTYLPVNIRIEEQAFGRAARSGDKGSGRMIIKVSDGEAQNRSLIYKLKQKRNVDELIHISAIKSYYETTIKMEEYCFKTFKELYIRKMKCLGNAIMSDPVKEILLQSCLDKWSFWLDENNALLRRSLDEATKRQVEKCLDQFIVQFDDLQAIDATSWSAWVEGNPMQMIKLAKFIAQHEPTHLETALLLFEKVIKNEPHFCEAAHYYRAYTRLLNNMNDENFKTDLRMAERLLDERVQSTLHASDVLGKLKTSSPHIEGYEEQKKSLINLYSLFIQSIDDMLGHAVTPDLFVNDEIKRDAAGQIFDDLVRVGMMKQTELVGNITNAQLHKYNSDYGISVERMKQFFASNAGTIDEEELLGSIRTSFSFPGRSKFWETLVQQNVLHSVKKYVAMNVERLGTDKCELMNVIQEKVEEGELVKETVKLEKNQVLLIHEQHSMTYFEENKLSRAIGQKNLFALKEKGLLLFNEKATIDKSKIADCVFSTFDSITAEDITNKTRITTSEANIIIIELLRQKILEKRGDSYALSDNHDPNILLPTYPVYESVIRSVLKSCFAYRLALRNIALQLEEKVCSEIRIELKRDPHRMFFNDLLEQKIIQPPRFNETFDVDEAVEKLCKNHKISICSLAAHHVKNVLNESKSSLTALNKSKANLKSIMVLQFKFRERKELFINIDEMRIFITNGLEHLVELTDKQWTAERMFNNTAVVLQQRGRAFNYVRLRPVNTRILKINHEQNTDLPNMIVETKRRLTEEYNKQMKKIKKKPPKSDGHLSSYGLELQKYLCFYGA